MNEMNKRKKRMAKIVAYLKGTYPEPKSELQYRTPFQFAVAVMLSAQCTDKAVNRLTSALFMKYKTPKDFVKVKHSQLAKELSSVPFFRNKARAIIGAAKAIVAEHGGVVPRNENELQKLPGIGYKTAHVITGELYDHWPGIATDTHVKRFAKKFGLTDQNDLKKISKDLEALIPKKDWKYINNGFVLYGRYICKAHKHDCHDHPLTKHWPKAAARWPKAR